MQVKIWFQNRRTKWKKQENISSAEAAEHKLSAEKHLLKSAKNKKQGEKAVVTGPAPPQTPPTPAGAASTTTAATAVMMSQPTTTTVLTNGAAAKPGFAYAAGLGSGAAAVGPGSNPSGVGRHAPFSLIPTSSVCVTLTPLPIHPTLTDTATSPGPVLDLSMDTEDRQDKGEEGETEPIVMDTGRGNFNSREELRDVAGNPDLFAERLPTREESPVNLVIERCGDGVPCSATQLADTVQEKTQNEQEVVEKDVNEQRDADGLSAVVAGREDSQKQGLLKTNEDFQGFPSTDLEGQRNQTQQDEVL